MNVLHVNKDWLKTIMIEDLLVVETRKLPKFLRYDTIKKEKQEKQTSFNKRQLKHSAH